MTEIEYQSGVPLADAIREVRAELLTAIHEGEGTPLRFGVESLELDFAVEIRSDTTKSAGIHVFVLSVGATGTVGSTVGHRLKVVLSAKTRDGTPVELASPEDFIPPRG